MSIDGYIDYIMVEDEFSGLVPAELEIEQFIQDEQEFVIMEDESEFVMEESTCKLVVMEDELEGYPQEELEYLIVQ